MKQKCCVFNPVFMSVCVSQQQVKRTASVCACMCVSPGGPGPLTLLTVRSLQALADGVVDVDVGWAECQQRICKSTVTSSADSLLCPTSRPLIFHKVKWDDAVDAPGGFRLHSHTVTSHLRTRLCTVTHLQPRPQNRDNLGCASATSV